MPDHVHLLVEVPPQIRGAPLSMIKWYVETQKDR